jgi:hypothetical protein
LDIGAKLAQHIIRFDGSLLELPGIQGTRLRNVTLDYEAL